ncbi:hypothetical protein BC828DRAFT_58586 [Blastocladiella britannica]|nr:hypothetical protein BC828DRAFT_58586 [Blastocladiella britannica]
MNAIQDIQQTLVDWSWPGRYGTHILAVLAGHLDDADPNLVTDLATLVNDMSAQTPLEVLLCADTHNAVFYTLALRLGIPATDIDRAIAAEYQTVVDLDDDHDLVALIGIPPADRGLAAVTVRQTTPSVGLARALNRVLAFLNPAVAAADTDDDGHIMELHLDGGHIMEINTGGHIIEIPTAASHIMEIHPAAGHIIELDPAAGHIMEMVAPPAGEPRDPFACPRARTTFCFGMRHSIANGTVTKLEVKKAITELGVVILNVAMEQPRQNLSILYFFGPIVNLQKTQALVRNLPRSLTELHLDRGQIGEAGAGALAQNWPPLLTKLWLTNNGIGDNGAKAIAAVLPPTLTTLWLNDNGIGTAGAVAIAAKLTPSMDTLWMCGNPIGDIRARAIAAELTPTLVELMMNNCDIGDEGARAIAAKLTPSLRTLWLSSNRIGNVGAIAIAKVLPIKLAKLWLSDNRIGDLGGCAIASTLPQTLKELHLKRNQFSDATKAALENAWPLEAELDL